MVSIFPFPRLWKAAQNLDSSSTSTQEEKDLESSFTEKQNKELKKANRELWKRVEELQKEKSSIAKENLELKRKIDQSESLPGNTLIPQEQFYINTSGPIKIKTEGEEGGVCACAENEELRRNLRDFQEKYSKTLKLLKVREMELEILKNSEELVQIE